MLSVWLPEGCQLLCFAERRRSDSLHAERFLALQLRLEVGTEVSSSGLLVSSRRKRRATSTRLRTSHWPLAEAIGVRIVSLASVYLGYEASRGSAEAEPDIWFSPEGEIRGPWRSRDTAGSVVPSGG